MPVILHLDNYKKEFQS